MLIFEMASCGSNASVGTSAPLVNSIVYFSKALLQLAFQPTHQSYQLYDAWIVAAVLRHRFCSHIESIWTAVCLAR